MESTNTENQKPTEGQTPVPSKKFEYEDELVRQVLSERLPPGKTESARFIELQNGVGLPFSKRTFRNRIEVHEYLDSIGVSDVSPFFNFLMERHSNLPLR